MIHIPTLRTKALVADFRELSLGDSLSIAAMPAQYEQAEMTAFLRRATDWGGSDPSKDPACWTVQQRTLAVGHYLAAMLKQDFSVGDDGSGAKFSDYLDLECQPDMAEVDVGSFGGDSWRIRHMTGQMAEAIEQLAGDLPGVEGGGRLHWLLCGMAAQMVRLGDDGVIDFTQPGCEHKLLERAKVFMGYAGSDASDMMALYLTGREKLHHLIRVDFHQDGGIVAMPKVAGAAVGGGGQLLPPARFPVRTCLGEIAW